MTESNKRGTFMSYDFADRLIEMRKTKGLSQEELAKRLGLSRQAVSKWERAESAPDISNLVALADIYDVSLDELVRGAMEVEEVEVDSVVVEVAEKGAEQAVAEKPAEANKAAEASAEPEAKQAAEAPAGPSQGSAKASVSAAAPQTKTDDAFVPPPTGQPVQVDPPITQPSASQKPKNPFLTFPYPLFIALVYLVLGFCFGLWHPCWVLFLTIPFYYWIVSVITHDPEYISRHQHTKD